MTETESKALAYLRDKRDILSEMLLLTERVKFNGDEDDGDKYIALMGKRQFHYEKMMEIDKCLEELKAGEGSEEFVKQAELLRNNAKTVAYEIIEMDKANAACVKQMKPRAEGNIKNMNIGKSMRNIYDNNLSLYNGYYIDQKK